MTLAQGQRWKYDDGRYVWIAEVTASKNKARILQIVKDPLISRGLETKYPIGRVVTIYVDQYWAYLEGQEVST